MLGVVGAYRELRQKLCPQEANYLVQKAKHIKQQKRSSYLVELGKSQRIFLGDYMLIPQIFWETY